ncbi:uncharacterized protein LOC135211796 [Macrobrachium nipponense]|uniref:uncharacterized protein LOC135211796 n=1 Tax=Macrobrachium nipponense TaxID=159736 RepID=UPI0030C814C5
MKERHGATDGETPPAEFPAPLEGSLTTSVGTSRCQCHNESKDGEAGVARNAAAGDCPPHSRWGWLVVLGSSLCFMLVGMQGPCFGIFYADRLQELGSSPSLAAWLFNLQAFWYNFAGPLAGPLSQKFGQRLVALVSGAVSSSSFVLSAYVTEPFLLLFTFSFFCGVGGGLCINCCFQMNTKYFKHRLGLANGIMMAGGSLGLILVPQLASYLQQIYPFEWANIIAGTVMMNAIPAAMLFHPVEWHMKQSKHYNVTDDAVPSTASQDYFKSKDHSDNESLRPLRSKSKIFSEPQVNNGLRGMPRGTSVPHDLLNPSVQYNRLSLLHSMRRNRTLSESPDKMKMNRNESCRNFGVIGTPEGSRLTLLFRRKHHNGQRSYTSAKSRRRRHSKSCLSFSQIISQAPEEEEEDSQRRGRASIPGLLRNLRCAQTAFWKDPLIMSVALFTSVTIPTAINIFAAVPFAMSDAGFSVQLAASAVSVNAVVDFFTRLFCALIVDQPWASPRMIYGLGQIVLICVPLGLMSGLHNYWVIFLCMGVLGVGLGIVYALDVFIIAYLAGEENLVLVFGISQFFRAIGFLMLGPIGGVLRDATGSYASAFLFFIGAVALAFMILIFTVFHTHHHSQSGIQRSSK